jgi:hypothetical protein
MDNNIAGEQEAVGKLDSAAILIENLFYQIYNPTVKQRVFLGNIGAKEFTLLNDTLGIKAYKYHYTIDKKEMNHALKRHGTDSPNAALGQQPITLKDFVNIPHILSFPDTMDCSTKTRKGLHAIVYIKNNTVLVMELRTGKKELAFITMYKI